MLYKLQQFIRPLKTTKFRKYRNHLYIIYIYIYIIYIYCKYTRAYIEQIVCNQCIVDYTQIYSKHLKLEIEYIIKDAYKRTYLMEFYRH